MTPHVDIMKLCFPIIQKLDCSFIYFSEGLLFLHSHIFSCAQSDGGEGVNEKDDGEVNLLRA